MPYPALAALCLFLDLAAYGALTRLVGLSPFAANLCAVPLSGIAVLALLLVRPAPAPISPGRRDPVRLGLCLVWIGLFALLSGHALNWLAGAGQSVALAKVAAAILHAAVSPPILRRLLTRATGEPVRLAGLGLGILAILGLAALPQPSAPHDPGLDVRGQYAEKRNPPHAALRVFHLGHSLVGRNMPVMLAQLADAGQGHGQGRGHDHALQLGWGTSLREHFEPDLTINGFELENATPRYRDAHEALASGEYDAFIMTEMVRLSDAIRYHHSTDYAAKWAAEAVAGNPDITIFLYETWHALDDTPDWLERLPDDLENQWTSALLWPAARAAGQPVYLIPAGQVMARLVTEVEASPDGIGELKSREDLFTFNDQGERDMIHPNDLGLYLVALTHYAVLYGASPIGLPHELLLEDGTPATAPSPELALRMQEIVWDVVRNLDLTGV